MPYGYSIVCVCKECDQRFDHAKKLSNHIKKHHDMSSVEYTIKHMYAGQRPQCLHCGGTTRFVSITLGFKQYCAEDQKIAESVMGKVGGTIKKSWNKGLTKKSDSRIAKLAEKMLGENNPFYGKLHTDEAKQRISNTKRLDIDVVQKRIALLSQTVTLLSNTYVDQNTPLNVLCNVCNTQDAVTLFNLQRAWRCRVCTPLGSKQQVEIVNFVNSLGYNDVVVSTRTVIPPYELDVWIPSKNVAIEYHGLYWHSGGKDGVVDKKRHRQKLLECQNKGIRLLQFFSDEWLQRNEVCRSMIRHCLGVSALKINARDCELHELTPKQSAEFLDANHIAGSTRAKKHFGLFHPFHGLVSVATIRTPVQKKWGKVIELARLASCINTVVRGGASKLLSHIVEWAKKNNYQGVLSYAELRYGTGAVYERSGLSLIDVSTINYWYTDGTYRYDRFKYRAQNGKTERQIAEENCVRPVYGCGNNVYLMLF